MMKRAIRNLHSDKSTPPRIFDVIVDGEKIDIEIKTDKKIEIVPWSDIVTQVDAAKEAARRAQKLPQIAP